MSVKQKVEILAPAGSFESLQAALQAEADAVYFGIEQLNMRARSSNNFRVDDLSEIARRCNEKGVRTYLTVNTVLYDHDINLMRRIVDSAKESGITAVIASDVAAIAYAASIGMPVHISTQANVCNLETVEFYAKFADTMVLARELSLKQVEDITKGIRRKGIKGPSGELIRIEVFAHGALCMAVSGKCYLSLHTNFASANRGACVQNCRRSYYVTDDEGNEFEVDNEYIMSAADLCTIELVDKMVDAGIDIFKIEGRGRSPDYVYTTVKCYKEAIQAHFDGSYNADKVADWLEELSTVFNRGFWEGYYLGRKMGEWSDVHGSKATKRKIFIGRGVKYFGNIGVGEFRAETHPLKLEDEIMITGPTTGLIQIKVKELRVGNSPVDQVKKGELFTMPVPDKIRPSDKLYKVVAATS